MLTYDLDARGGLPLYDYLYRCIKGDILSGSLRPGERLPSKRSLARHLEVGVVTVENAYAQLVAEGYLYTKEKRGYFVSPLEPRLPPPTPPQAVLKENPPPVWRLDLAGAGAGAEGFPFTVWAKLMRQVLADQGTNLLQAIPHSGIPELRQAISHYLYHFRGISADPEQIVVGAGSEYLENLIVQLLGRDLVYAVEDPGYAKPGRVYDLNGARCIALAVDGQGLSPDIVSASHAQVLHVSPSHQFPTGAITPIARRQALLHWAAGEEKRYIVEDDYDSEFRFTGRPIPSLQSIDRAERVIYLNTFSRALAPSLRISYMVLPPALLERYRRRLGFYACTVPAMEQYTLARFLSEGYFEQHINRARSLCRIRRDRVIAAFANSPLSRQCHILGADAGLHFLVRLDTRRRDQDLDQMARAQGLHLSLLFHYCTVPSQNWAHHLVVNYLGVKLEQLPEALERLSRLL